MLSKHIDVVALLAIMLGLLIISRTPEMRPVRDARSAGIRIHNALSRIEPCPFSKVLVRFR